MLCFYLTFSSVEWSKAVPSEKEADLPTLFVKIYPTLETIEDLERRKRDIRNINKSMHANDFNIRKRIRKVEETTAKVDISESSDQIGQQSGQSTAEVDLNLSNDEVKENPVSDQPAATEGVPSGVAHSESLEENAFGTTSSNSFELVVCARRNWKSMTVNLWPGEYVVVCSVEYASSVKQSVGVEDKLKDSFVKPKAKSLWKIAAENDHRVWAQASSHANIKLLPLGHETETSEKILKQIAENFMESIERITNQNLKPNIREMWPFCVEHQLDTGTIGLTQILYRLRRETNLVLSELFSLRIKHQDQFRKLDAIEPSAKN